MPCTAAAGAAATASWFQDRNRTSTLQQQQQQQQQQKSAFSELQVLLHITCSLHKSYCINYFLLVVLQPLQASQQGQRNPPALSQHLSRHLCFCHILQQQASQAGKHPSRLEHAQGDAGVINAAAEQCLLFATDKPTRHPCLSSLHRQLHPMLATHLPCRSTSRGTFAFVTSKQQQASQAGRQPSGQTLPRVMLVSSMQLLRLG
jgi:hypothetical protein